MFRALVIVFTALVAVKTADAFVIAPIALNSCRNTAVVARQRHAFVITAAAQGRLNTDDDFLPHNEVLQFPLS